MKKIFTCFMCIISIIIGVITSTNVHAAENSEDVVITINDASIMENQVCVMSFKKTEYADGAICIEEKTFIADETGRIHDFVDAKIDAEYEYTILLGSEVLTFTANVNNGKITSIASSIGQLEDTAEETIKVETETSVEEEPAVAEQNFFVQIVCENEIVEGSTYKVTRYLVNENGDLSEESNFEITAHAPGVLRDTTGECEGTYFYKIELSETKTLETTIQIDGELLKTLSKEIVVSE